MAYLVMAMTSDVYKRQHLAYVDFPRHIVNTFLGILKYSTVLAKANEFGGITQTSDWISTKLFASKDLGSTIAE